MGQIRRGIDTMVTQGSRQSMCQVAGSWDTASMRRTVFELQCRNVPDNHRRKKERGRGIRGLGHSFVEGDNHNRVGEDLCKELWPWEEHNSDDRTTRMITVQPAAMGEFRVRKKSVESKDNGEESKREGCGESTKEEDKEIEKVSLRPRCSQIYRAAARPKTQSRRPSTIAVKEKSDWDVRKTHGEGAKPVAKMWRRRTVGSNGRKRKAEWGEEPERVRGGYDERRGEEDREDGIKGARCGHWAHVRRVQSRTVKYGGQPDSTPALAEDSNLETIRGPPGKALRHAQVYGSKNARQRSYCGKAPAMTRRATTP
ncbi:hypothetical protein C8J57DRAFT_1253471 [Mycena rebaudengoi]|nr:hypothetical protein C8J57DRAFT_1253471 [Mycena rebaudengoi]